MLAYLLLKLKLPENGTPTADERLLLTREIRRGLHLPLGSAPVFAGSRCFRKAPLLSSPRRPAFIGGPKCLANMAHDSWVPHWFGSLSERLASHNGILLIGVSSLAALWANREAAVSALVVMYSINVFRDVFAVDDRHGPALVSAATRQTRCGGGDWRCLFSARSDVHGHSGVTI